MALRMTRGIRRGGGAGVGRNNSQRSIHLEDTEEEVEDREDREDGDRDRDGESEKSSQPPSMRFHETTLTSLMNYIPFYTSIQETLTFMRDYNRLEQSVLNWQELVDDRKKQRATQTGNGQGKGEAMRRTWRDRYHEFILDLVTVLWWRSKVTQLQQTRYAYASSTVRDRQIERYSDNHSHGQQGQGGQKSYRDQQINQELPNLLQFLESMRLVRRISIALMLVIVLGTVPLYIVLKQRYSTYSDQYRWNVSAVFMSGFIPAIAIFAVWALTLLIICVIIDRYIPIDIVEDLFTPAYLQSTGVTVTNVSSTNSASSEVNALAILASDNLATNTTRTTSTPTLTPMPNTSVDGSQQQRTRSSIFFQTLPGRESLFSKATDASSRFAQRMISNTEFSAKYVVRRVSGPSMYMSIIALLINMCIVLIVKACFLYLLIQANSSFEKLVIEFLLSLTDLIWDNFAVPSIITNLPKKKSTSRMLLKTSMLFFNSIVAPCIAIAVVDSSCFLGIFQVSSPEYRSDEIFYCPTLFSTQQCVEIERIVNEREYTPLFYYNYNCYSNIMNEYLPVFFISFIFLTFFNPCLAYLLINSPKSIKWKSLKLLPTIYFIEDEVEVEAQTQTETQTHGQMQEQTQGQTQGQGQSSRTAGRGGEGVSVLERYVSRRERVEDEEEVENSDEEIEIDQERERERGREREREGKVKADQKQRERQRDRQSDGDEEEFIGHSATPSVRESTNEKKCNDARVNLLKQQEDSAQQRRQRQRETETTTANGRTPCLKRCGKQKKIFYPDFLLATLMHHMIVMLTFGVIYPPLAVAIAVEICMKAFTWEVILGRWMVRDGFQYDVDQLLAHGTAGTATATAGDASAADPHHNERVPTVWPAVEISRSTPSSATVSPPTQPVAAAAGPPPVPPRPPPRPLALPRPRPSLSLSEQQRPSIAMSFHDRPSVLHHHAHETDVEEDVMAEGVDRLSRASLASVTSNNNERFSVYSMRANSTADPISSYLTTQRSLQQQSGMLTRSASNNSHRIEKTAVGEEVVMNPMTSSASMKKVELGAPVTIEHIPHLPPTAAEHDTSFNPKQNMYGDLDSGDVIVVGKHTRELEALCKDVGCGPRRCLGLISYGTAVFFGLVLLDMAGDSYGWKRSLWAPIGCMVFVTLVILYLKSDVSNKEHRSHQNHVNNEQVMRSLSMSNEERKEFEMIRKMNQSRAESDEEEQDEERKGNSFRGKKAFEMTTIIR
jgi:hypothetical protein